MGCVLGKRATSSKPTKQNQQKFSARHNVEHLVSFPGVRGNIKDGVVDRIRQSIGEAPAPDRRGLKPVYGVKTSQGWPAWLVDVAGDAIKDWKPRRANTFEKIDKVVNPTKTLICSFWPIIIHTKQLE